MRIRVGDHLEVWTQEAASPVGAWRGGHVTWGNGHSYTLMWHDGGELSGRILRKLVRPRPPPAPVPRDLDAGDMVEVFDEDDCLWKCAEVQGSTPTAADDDGGDRKIDVKIVGAAKVLTVPPRMLRIRQVLRDDDVWIALHKDNQVAVPGPGTMQLRANGGRIGMGIGGGKGSYKPPMKPGFQPLLKKRAFGTLGSNTIANGKRFKECNDAKMLCAKEKPRDEVKVIVPNVCLNKQDDMSSEDYGTVRISTNSVVDHHKKQHEYKEEDEDEDDSVSSSSDDSSSSDSDSRTKSIEADEDHAMAPDSDSRTKSIEACEDHAVAPASRPCGDQKADQLQLGKKEHCEEDVSESREVKEEEQCEGISESREIKREPLRDQMAAVRVHIHRLELEAYTALTKAFHACGKQLTWEKMDLLTDLREHLHISNEEHLQVLNIILNRKQARFGGPRNV
ncbi:hypothetical protein BS78_03G192500 [Paspalum vaginatum]|nr:hypothetical protein BS78_03G192500 [Paspalum vaginatum]